MSRFNPTAQEFVQKIKSDFPNSANMSEENIVAALEHARDNASGMGAGIKRNTSNAALEFIDEYTKDGGSVHEALEALGSSSLDLETNGKLNPEIIKSLKANGQWPENASAPTAPTPDPADLPSGHGQSPAVPITPAGPDPDDPSGGGASSAPATPSAQPIAGGDPKAQLAAGVVTLVMNILKDPSYVTNGGLANFLEEMPPELAEYMEQNIPPEILEGLMDMTEMLTSGQSIGGTGHGLFSSLKGVPPTPSIDNANVTPQADPGAAPIPGMFD